MTCNKSFKWNKGLKRHMKNHTNSDQLFRQVGITSKQSTEHLKTHKRQGEQPQPSQYALPQYYQDSYQFPSNRTEPLPRNETALHTSDDPFVIHVKTEENN